MSNIIDLPINNKLWDDSTFYAEEMLCGLPVTFTVTKAHNIIESGNEQIQHCFQDLKNLPLYPYLKETTFSAILVPPPGIGQKFLKTLVKNGAMGSERLQLHNGSVRIVLTDLWELSGVSLRDFKFRDRRVYLESLTSTLIEQRLTDRIIISDIIKRDKLSFFQFIKAKGARGVILKNSNGVCGEDSFKITANTGGVGNITIQKNWQMGERIQESLDEFDYDTMMAMVCLNDPKNEAILLAIK